MTSAYLEPARRRHAEVRAEVRTITDAAQRAGRDLTADELGRVTTLAGEANRLAEAIEGMAREDARAGAVAASAVGAHRGEGQADGDDYLRGARPLGSSMGAAGVESLGALGAGAAQVPAAAAVPALLPSAAQAAEQIEHMRSREMARRWAVDGDHERAAVTTANAGYAALTIPPRGTQEPRRIAVAAGLPVEEVEGYVALSWPVFGPGAADVVAELATKPAYTAVTTDTARPVTIAITSEFSTQTDLTVPGYRTALQRKLAQFVAKRENALVVAQVVAAAPAQMTAPTGQRPADSLLAAAATIVDDAEVPPTMALVNPADVVRILGGEGASGPNGEAPAAGLRLAVAGLDLFPTSLVAAGSAIVGAWAAGMTFILGQRPTLLVDPFTKMDTNVIRVRLEEGVTAVLHDKTTFRRVAFAA